MIFVYSIPPGAAATRRPEFNTHAMVNEIGARPLATQ